jgi:hypothetical protein
MTRARVFLIPVALVLLAARSAAQEHRFNGVAPTLSATVALDASGKFVYQYTIANGATATQRINFVLLELGHPASEARAPKDWDGMLASSSVVWTATGAIDPSWSEAHKMDIPSFTSEIAPGASRAGFEIVSSCGGANVPLTFYARGYNHLETPSEEEEQPAGSEFQSWRDDAVQGTVLGPADCSTVADWGNRSPGVDGFLGVVNFVNGATMPAGPMTVQIRFSRDGEVVNLSTFSAVLNSTDVTASFTTNASGDKVAVFESGSSPLHSGKNVLLLKVEGIKPGTTSTAMDADRFIFTIP